MQQPETPTLDRMQAPHAGGWTRREGEPCRLVDHSQLIGEFLDWLDTEDIHLAVWRNEDENGEELLFPTLEYHHETRERILARHFGIDLNDVENEKRALLDWIRSQHKENDERASESEPDRNGAADREHPAAEATG